MSNFRSRVSKLNSGSGGGVSRKSSKATPTYKEPEVFWSNWYTQPPFTSVPRSNGATFTVNNNVLYVTPKSGLISFETSDVDYGGNVDASGCPNLTNLIIEFAQISSLDISGSNNISNLICEGNLLTSLNVSALSSLSNLNCSTNQLTSLNVSQLSNLLHLNCDANQFTTLNVSGLSSLRTLSCGLNQLTTLNVSGLKNITQLQCIYNQLTSLNVSGLSSLSYIGCQNNQLTSLNVSGLSSLSFLTCQRNRLTQPAVDNILASMVANNYTSQQTTKIIDLSGGANATPSLTGLTYIPTLTSRGWDVFTN